METDLIFHHGVDLPLFAAFPLVDSPSGRSLLMAYYDEYAAIARRAGAGLMLESATWRASSDWGDRLGYSPRTWRGSTGTRSACSRSCASVTAATWPTWSSAAWSACAATATSPARNQDLTRRPATTRPRSRPWPRPAPTSSRPTP